MAIVPVESLYPAGHPGGEPKSKRRRIDRALDSRWIWPVLVGAAAPVPYVGTRTKTRSMRPNSRAAFFL